MKTTVAWGMAVWAFSCARALGGDKPLGVDEVLAKMEQAGKKLTTLTARFRQERIYSLFDEKRVSSGTIKYKKPGRMLWRYGPPDNNSIYINGRRALMYLPDISQVQKVSLLKDRKTESLLIGFGNTAEEITRNFSVALRGSGGKGCTLELTPKSKETASQLQRLEITLDRASWLPVKSVRHEPGGDRTVFTFTDVKVNAPLEDSLFEFTAPEGVEVVEY